MLAFCILLILNFLDACFPWRSRYFGVLAYEHLNSFLGTYEILDSACVDACFAQSGQKGHFALLQYYWVHFDAMQGVRDASTRPHLSRVGLLYKLSDG